MKRILPLFVLAALIAAIAYMLHRPQAQAPGIAPEAADANGVVPFRMEQQWLIRMKLAQAEEARLHPQIHSTGRIIPAASRRALVASPVAGTLQTQNLPRIGQKVMGGEVLASVVQTPTAAEAAQIHIENTRVEAERRRLAQAELEAVARLRAAVAEAERAGRLLEKKAYSQRQVESAKADQAAAEALLAGIRDQAKALQPGSASASYSVTAPLAGTVVEVRKALGEEVRAGEPILEIVALDRVWVEAPIFEKDLGRLTKALEARFTTSAFGDREFQGRLIDVGSVVDEQTRAAKVVFEVSNASGELRLGMQANLRLDWGEKATVVLVPKEAILDNEGKKILYVLRTGEEFERRDVVVGDQYGDKVAVVSGVRAGERVVTQGAYQMKLQELKPANAGAHTHEV